MVLIPGGKTTVLVCCGLVVALAALVAAQQPPARASRVGSLGRARQVPRHGAGLQRVPHAFQERRARHDPDAVRASSKRAGDQPTGTARRVQHRHQRHQHGMGRALGRFVHHKPHARSRDRYRQVEREDLHERDSFGEEARRRTRTAAAHAVEDVCEPDRRRSQVDLRIPEDDSGQSPIGFRTRSRREPSSRVSTRSRRASRRAKGY